MRLLSLLLAIAAVPLLLAAAFSGGPPPGYTGAPGESSCIACHNSHALNSGTGSITVEAPETFLPGEAVSLTVRIDNTTPPAGDAGVQGFELTVADAAGNFVGTLTPEGDGTQLAFGSPAYVSHTAAGINADSWTLTWTAPAEPPASVTIYAAGNAADGNGAVVGDYVYTTAVSMALQGTDAEDPVVPAVWSIGMPYPNPVSAQQTLHVPFAMNESRQVAIAVYDGLGRKVTSTPVQRRSVGDHVQPLELSDMLAGTYFVALEGEGDRVVAPITVVR